jgi:hypothetical protein
MNASSSLVRKGHPLRGPLSREILPLGKKIIVSLLRYSDCVAYRLRQSLFFAFAGMFLGWCRGICAADLYRTCHPSGSRPPPR